MTAMKPHCPACASVLATELDDDLRTLIVVAETAGWDVTANAHRLGRITLTLGRPGAPEDHQWATGPHEYAVGLTVEGDLLNGWRLTSAWKRDVWTNDGATDRAAASWLTVDWLNSFIRRSPARAGGKR